MTAQPPLFGGYQQTDVNALPLRERPASRVIADSSACNMIELLAAIIGGPRQIETATALMTKFGSTQGIVSASVADIAHTRGIGNVTAARLKAALELGLRSTAMPPEKFQINSPADAYHILNTYFVGKEQEYLFVLMMDTRSRVIGAPVEVYHGSLNMTAVRIGELFREAIRWNAASIVVAHNHPSNDPSPSPDDVAVTRLIVEAGKLLDILVQDHLVIGASRFVSMKERGLGNFNQ